MWLENLDRLPPLKKQDGEHEEHEEEDDENEDSDDHAEEVKKKYMRPKTPPPPRFVTDWTVRSSTLEEKEDFQEQVRQLAVKLFNRIPIIKITSLKYVFLCHNKFLGEIPLR